MTLTVAFDRERDGRWIASVQDLPGAHVSSQADATARARDPVPLPMGRLLS
jgi:hypothetical protein